MKSWAASRRCRVHSPRGSKCFVIAHGGADELLDCMTVEGAGSCGLESIVCGLDILIASGGLVVCDGGR